MDDLISRQEAIDEIMGQPPEPHYPSWYAEQIKKLPSAQPELVWCKDCKWYDPTHPYGTIVAAESDRLFRIRKYKSMTNAAAMDAHAIEIGLVDPQNGGENGS